MLNKSLCLENKIQLCYCYINQLQGSYWKNIEKERLRAIFSQCGPELVMVNKKLIVWLLLNLLFTMLLPTICQLGINIAHNVHGH